MTILEAVPICRMTRFAVPRLFLGSTTSAELDDTRGEHVEKKTVWNNILALVS